MVLENFIIDTTITWDRVSKSIFEHPQAKPGRKLRVQVTNAGVIEDLTGSTLNLGWKNQANNIEGLDVFTAVDITKGLFEIAYTSGMLSNVGSLKASLLLIDVSEVTIAESNDFVVRVAASSVSQNAGQSVGSWTTLAEILLNEDARVQNEAGRVQAELTRAQTFDDLVDSEMIAQNVATKLTEKEATFAPRMLSVEQQLEQAEADILLINRGLGTTYQTMASLLAAYPTGHTYDHIVAGDLKEVDTLTVTAIPAIAGNITVTLNGIDKVIAVDPAVQTTTTLLATLIRGNTFTGWTTGGTGAVVTFTATTAATRTAPVFTPAATGVAAGFVRTVIGEAPNYHRYFWNGSAWTDGGAYQAIESNTEVKDIRVGADGITYPTAAEAVRGQVNAVKAAVGYSIDTLSATKTTGFYLNIAGAAVSNAISFITDYVEVTPGMKVTVDNIYLPSSRAMCAYDKDQNFVAVIANGTDVTTLTFEVEATWKFIRVTGAVSRGDIKASYTDITQSILDITDNIFSQNKTLSNFEGTKLLTGADLNNLTFGAYYVDSDVVTQSLLNAPIGITGALKIIYIPTFGTKGIMYLMDAYSKSYVRQYNGVSWISWNKNGTGTSYPYHRADIDRTELAPAIETFTPTLATWNSTDIRWELGTGGRLSTDIVVQANVPYLITIGYVKGTNQMGDWDNGTLFDVVLGAEQISIYALNDANWRVMLIPEVSGTVTLTLGSDLWRGYIYSCSVIEVASLAIPNFSYNEADVRSYDTSIGIGMYTHQKLAYDASSENNGKRNTAFGMRTQENLDTGYDNTAVGYQAQMNLTNGLGNTALGKYAQRNVTVGVYNTGVGWNAQANITSGNWNTALGLEAQLMLTTGVNNVSIGRRSSDVMTTGSHNVHIGAHSGFYPKPTIDSEGQVFVGQQATQLTDGRHDRAIAIGQFAHADADAIAIGAGVDAQANTIVIGKATHETVKIAGKTIHFNVDGSVTWTE